MDVIGYRNSGELSDITVVVDGQEFNLHKFPLFVRSNYFKNLSSLSQPTATDKPARVELENFPGGSRTFAIIADYCYNKEVNLNSDNVIDVRCAAEYLEMTGGAGRGGLVMLADNVLFDLIYSAKAKRDYHYSLSLLDRAAKHFGLAEKSGINQKLVESFADNLSIFVKTSSVYDSFPLYNADSKSSSSRSLHKICLTEEDTINLNDLPLKWMNDLVKACAKSGLHQSLLSYIIQNYIDHNTGLNYEAPEQPAVDTPNTNRSEKPTNLIAVAADILKAQNKLSNLAAEPSNEQANQESEESNSNDSSSGKPTNLIDIASVILKGAQAENKEIEEQRSEEEEKKPRDLIQTADEDQDEKPANLINIASVILSKKDDETDSKPEEKPTSLVNILGDILKTHEKLSNNVAEEEEKKPTEPKKALREPKRLVPDEEKIKILSSLSKTLQDAQINPQFPISWLLFYTNALHQLNADPEVKSAFHKWTWNSLNNIKTSSNELSSIPPSVMIQLAQDVAGKDETDRQKLVELTEKYIGDLDKQDKLDLDTFKQLVSCIPKEERSSFDNLMQILLKKLDKDNLEDKEKLNDLLSHIDFSKLNEKTLEECKKNGSIPLNLIADAALNLCHKLRKELDDAKLKLKSHEIKSHPYVSTSTNRYSNSSDSSSPSAYNSKYSSPLSKMRSSEIIKPAPKSTDIPIITTRASTIGQTTSPSAYKTSSSNRVAYPESANTTSRYNYTLKTPHLTYSTSTSRPSSTLLSSTYRSNFNPPVSTYYYHHQQEHYYGSDDDFLCENFDHNLNDEDVYDYYSSAYSYSKK